jgi:hypothetical protein
MPYVSEAQRRFFHSKGAKKAGISAATVKEYDEASRGKKLPEKVSSKQRGMKKVHHSPTMNEVDCHQQYSMTPVK